MISILSIEILASIWPDSINFLMVDGVKSVILPNVASVLSSLSIRQTFDMRGFPRKRSLYVVNLYSPTLDILFAFFSNISSTFFERPFELCEFYKFTSHIHKVCKSICHLFIIRSPVVKKYIAFSIVNKILILWNIFWC